MLANRLLRVFQHRGQAMKTPPRKRRIGPEPTALAQRKLPGPPPPFPLLLLHNQLTSKQMFSPSRSQSSHRTMMSQPLASRPRCSTTWACVTRVWERVSVCVAQKCGKGSLFASLKNQPYHVPVIVFCLVLGAVHQKGLPAPTPATNLHEPPGNTHLRDGLILLGEATQHMHI